MAKKINPLVLSYPNFVLGAIIDPEEANQNNSDITNKINEFITEVEEALQISENADAKADQAILDSSNAIDIATTLGNEAINTATTLGNEAKDIASTLGSQAIDIANNAIDVATNAEQIAISAEGVATSIETSYNTLKPELESAINDANMLVEHIEEIIDGTIFDKVGAVVKTGKFIALEDGVNTFTIPISTYNPDYDFLSLTFSGVDLEEDVNYTRAERVITLLFNLNQGEEVNYFIFKNTLIDPTLSDGTLLMDGSVFEEKLSVALQDKINTINTHINDFESPHLYLDEGINPDFQGVKYRLVVKDGRAFMEVVSNG